MGKGLAVCLVFLVAACGGTVIEDGALGSGGTGGTGGAGGQSGTGGSTDGGTGGSGGEGGTGGSIPDPCAVQTSAPGPYEVTFTFVNSSPMTVYLLEECRLRYDVKACSDGYTGTLPIDLGCSMDCSDPNASCVACEACLPQFVAVGPGMQTSVWYGHTYTFGTLPQGCQCHIPSDVPASKYRIDVPVYDQLGDPSVAQPAYHASEEFELPSTDGQVRVDLSPPTM